MEVGVQVGFVEAPLQMSVTSMKFSWSDIMEKRSEGIP